MKHKKAFVIFTIILVLSLSVGGATYYFYDTMVSVEDPNGNNEDNSNFFQKYIRSFYNRLQNE